MGFLVTGMGRARCSRCGRVCVTEGLFVAQAFWGAGTCVRPPLLLCGVLRARPIWAGGVDVVRYRLGMSGQRELGWAVHRRGTRPQELLGEFGGVATELQAEWAAHFPARLGYVTVQRPLASDVEGDVEGVSLEVLRGDFRATCNLRCVGATRRGVTSIVLNGGAASHRLDEQREGGSRFLRRVRPIGAACGLILAALVSLEIYEQLAHAVVGSMLVFVIMFAAPVVGWHLVDWVVQRMMSMRRARLAAEAVEDQSLQGDFRRWDALGRRLAAKRRELVRGAHSGPFRQPAALS